MLCRVLTLNMNWLQWQQTTVLHCPESAPLTKAESVCVREMCARQIVQPTDIHSPDGKMEIYSFSAHLPHRLIRLTMAGSFLSVSEPFCTLRRKSFISLQRYCLSCMLEDPSGNKSGIFFFYVSSSDLLLVFSINLFQRPQQHIYFHFPTFCHVTVLKVQQQAFVFA